VLSEFCTMKHKHMNCSERNVQPVFCTRLALFIKFQSFSHFMYRSEIRQFRYASVNEDTQSLNSRTPAVTCYEQVSHTLDNDFCSLYSYTDSFMFSATVSRGAVRK
jgi:hypothetical protein